MTDDAPDHSTGRTGYVDPLPRAALGLGVGALAGVIVNVVEPGGLSAVTAVVLMACGAAGGYWTATSSNRRLIRKGPPKSGEDRG